jgi:hypothetical protein
MRKFYIPIILNFFLINYGWAQDAATNNALILGNAGNILANTGSISANTGNIDNLRDDLISTNADVAALRVHSDEQDIIMLDRAKVFASRLSAMSIATANSTNSMGSDAKLGLGFGYGEVYGEDAFAIGLVSRADNKKVSMSFNIGFNRHLDQTIGAGIFFKLQ